MLESERINKEIEDLANQISKLEDSKQNALLAEEQRSFLEKHRGLLTMLDGLESKEKLGQICQTTHLNDLLNLISIHLGHDIKVPAEVGNFFISQILNALELIQNDDRFVKYRG